jgi:hypothetical protein
MLQWVIRASDYWYLFRGYPRILSVYAPIVEFWGILVLFAFGLACLRQWLSGERVSIELPGVKLFALFLLSAVLSLVNVDRMLIVSSAWYLIRVLLFLYIVYVVLGANIIKTKETFRRSLIVLAMSGLFGAFVGLLSLFNGAWQEIYGSFRATPFFLYHGWAPFGDQHIFLAEVLTTVFPLFVYLWYTEKNVRKKQWWWIGTVFVVTIALLTFSRAGWVTLTGLAGVWMLLYEDRSNMWNRLRSWWIGILLSIPIVVYFIYFVFTNTLVIGSNAARIALTEIPLFFFFSHPYVGNGVGSFVSMLSEVHFFLLEFGDSIDAHGFIQKILTEQGVFGLITFCMFVGSFVVLAYKRYTSAQYDFNARMVGLLSLFLILSPLLFQLFNTQYYTAKMWVPVALAIIGLRVYERKDIRDRATMNFLTRKKYER